MDVFLSTLLSFLPKRYREMFTPCELPARSRNLEWTPRSPHQHWLAAANSLQIASCRPKPWTQLTTISHDGVLYELAGEDKGLAPRPFVYILRKKPTTAVIRGIHDYNPDEVLEVGK